MSTSSDFLSFCSNLRMDEKTVSDIQKRYHQITKRINLDYWNSDSITQHSLYVGSYGRGTEIWTSDIDIIVQLPYRTYEKFNSYTRNGQSALLQEVKSVLQKTYSKSYVKGDGATNKTLVSLAASAHIKTFLSGVFNEEDLDLDTNVDKGELNINVINEVGKKLPVTGTPALVALYVAGIGMMAAVVVKSRKKEDTI